MEPARTHYRPVLEAPVRGFTLVEMLVVLGIIVIITGVALMGQSNFNRSLILTDTAYRVALSVREAQSLGLSSRKVIGVGVQNAGYGVYITEGSTYVQFADTYPPKPGDDLPGGICAGHTEETGPEARPGNCLFDNGQDATVATYRFDRGMSVTRFCGENTSGALVCSDSGTPLSSMSIVFLRPNTESLITGVRSGSPLELVKAEIYISSADGEATRAVCVSKVGQVSVATSTCP